MTKWHHHRAVRALAICCSCGLLFASNCSTGLRAVSAGLDAAAAQFAAEEEQDVNFLDYLQAELND